MFRAIDHCGNIPSLWRSPGNQRHGGVNFDARRPLARCGEYGAQQVGLAVPGKTRQADNLAFMRQKLRDSLVFRPDPNMDWCPPTSCGVRIRLRALLRDAPHGNNQLSAIEGLCAVGSGNLAVTHHHDPIAAAEDFAQKMGNEDEAHPACYRTAHEGQQLAGCMGVQRRSRLVQNDQGGRLVCHGEGARHLDHLAAAEGEVLHQIGRADTMAGENLVQPGRDQRGRPAPPAETAQRRMKNPRILRHRQVRAERQFLEHATDAQLFGAARGIVLLFIPCNEDAPMDPGAAMPASTCIRVDLPAPLWPTRPMHSPRPITRSTPPKARTVPNCFSTPSSLTKEAPGDDITSGWL